MSHLCFQAGWVCFRRLQLFAMSSSELEGLRRLGGAPGAEPQKIVMLFQCLLLNQWPVVMRYRFPVEVKEFCDLRAGEVLSFRFLNVSDALGPRMGGA